MHGGVLVVGNRKIKGIVGFGITWVFEFFFSWQRPRVEMEWQWGP